MGNGKEFQYNYPGFFSFEEKRRYIKLKLMVEEIYGKRVMAPDIEALICINAPAAKDIIAERSILDDNKD